MLQGKRSTDEFKLEAVKRITERGVPVKELSDRLGVSTWSLYKLAKHYAVQPEQRKEQVDQTAKICRLESKLKWMTEGFDILKNAQPTYGMIIGSTGRNKRHDREGRLGFRGRADLPG